MEQKVVLSWRAPAPYCPFHSFWTRCNVNFDRTTVWNTFSQWIFDFIRPRTLSVKRASLSYNARWNSFKEKAVIVFPIVSEVVCKMKKQIILQITAFNQLTVKDSGPYSSSRKLYSTVSCFLAQPTTPELFWEVGLDRDLRKHPHHYAYFMIKWHIHSEPQANRSYWIK